MLAMVGAKFHFSMQDVCPAWRAVLLVTEQHDFCLGIWDCQSSQAVVEFVRRGIAAKQDLDKICENMMDNCLASNSETGGVGCDNMTMSIIGFLNGKTKDEWYEEIAKRVANGDGPCAPPEYGTAYSPKVEQVLSSC